MLHNFPMKTETSVVISGGKALKNIGYILQPHLLTKQCNKPRPNPVHQRALRNIEEIALLWG
jgi:hypothetical protein